MSDQAASQRDPFSADSLARRVIGALGDFAHRAAISRFAQLAAVLVVAGAFVLGTVVGARRVRRAAPEPVITPMAPVDPAEPPRSALLTAPLAAVGAWLNRREAAASAALASAAAALGLDARSLVIVRWMLAALALYSGYQTISVLRGPEHPGWLAEGLGWLVASALAFGLALTGQSDDQPWVLTNEIASAAKMSVRQRRLVAVGLALGGSVIITYPLHLLGTRALVIGWLAAQIIWIVAFVPVRRWPRLVLPRPLRLRDWLTGQSTGLGRAVEAGLVASLLLIAAGLRLWNSYGLPLNFHGDMASYGLQARELLAGKPTDFFGYGWSNIPLVGYWPTAISLALFGDTLTGLNTVPAFEAVAALLALYLLVRELWGWRPAIFALAFGVGDIVLIHYGREAAYMDPVPFVAFALYFLVRGLRHGRHLDFAAAGVIGAYAAQTYFSGRILFPLALVAVALTFLASPRLLWSRRWGLTVATIGLVIALGPSLVSFVGSPATFNERAREVSIYNPATWNHSANKYHVLPTDGAGVMLSQVQRSALGFWKYDDAATQFGIERNSLSSIAGVLLILGLGLAAFRLNRLAIALIVAWLLGYILSSILTGDPPSSMHIIGMYLPVAILCALALDQLIGLVTPSGRTPSGQTPIGRTWVVAGVVAGLVVAGASGALNWRDYVEWGTSGRSVLPRAQVARWLLSQPTVGSDQQPTVRVISRDFFWTDREFKFLLKGWRGESLDLEKVQRGQISWTSEPTIYIVSPDSKAVLPALAAQYPGGRLVDPSIPPTTGIFAAFCTDPGPDPSACQGRIPK